MTTITECQLALNEKQTLLQTSHFHVLLFEISVELIQGSISTQFLGPAGGVLAMLGVIAAFAAMLFFIYKTRVQVATAE
jgi:hypothetical protein